MLAKPRVPNRFPRMKTVLNVCCILAAVSLANPSNLPATDDAPRVVQIHAGVGNVVKFDVSRIPASPGETLKIVLTNSSSLPKNLMGHNWFLLKAGSDVVAFATAAAPEVANAYFPAKLSGQVIAHIGLLGPGQSGEVIFKAPSEPGDYPFLCSFPGHALIGMKGLLVVAKK